MSASQFKSASHRFARAPLAAAVLLLSPGLMAQDSGGLEEVLVTAQKRSQNLQDVPISIESFNTEKIAELGIQNFQDYAKMLPSVAIQPTPYTAVGSTLVYMRGIATGRDGQATTSQPSVGMYLDEQPITTIQGNLDIHMYDIARVEALAGPQGTLYGASSQAGTIRVITNKPDPSEFSAGYGIEGNVVDGDDTGYTGEGFVNVPISDNMAIRLVGWARHDAGWIDNVRGTRTYPGVGGTTADDIILDNEDRAEDDYNTIDTYGVRASLRIDLNEDWTITPQFQYQKQEGEGSWGDDLSDFASGDNEVTHFKEEYADDEWWQAGLTIEGTISDFDVVYSGSYLDRDFDGSFDYSDYSYWYDTIYTTGYYADLHFLNEGDRAVPNQFFPDAGTRIMPGARFTNDDGYEKWSHELRVSSPADNRLRGMVGLFYQNQKHDFQQHWLIEGLGDIMLMDQAMNPRFADTVYLNSLDREDTDEAVFASVSFDITDSLELTGGIRYFKPEVTVEGFFGFGLGFNGVWSGTGEIQCATQENYKDKPCKNVDKNIDEDDSVGRINLTWKISDDHMVYGTWSEGYRPGGINRAPNAGEYISDFLTNWEAGWKTVWLDNRLQFNGAIFYEEWEDFQVSFVGANAITQVDNGPTADVYGMEGQVQWVPIDPLTISASWTYLDSELQDDYCPGCEADGSPWAPDGTELPISADFKGNLVARYHFDLASFDAHVQGAVAYEGERNSDLRVSWNEIKGELPESTIVDLSAGIRNEMFAVELFVKNATDEDASAYLVSQCATSTCGAQNYGVRPRPRTFGVRFSQDF
jgi:outer membrane receptor protein involved in Fe transport